MNTTTDHTPDPSARPFGFWLTAVDRLLADAFATAFADEGATRRDWRLLNVVDGSAPSRRPLNPHKLRGLIDRGWVWADGETWTLTDEGRAAKERLGAVVDGIRATVSDAVSAEDMATTLASLEGIARALGWDEDTPLPRKHRHGRGHGHRFGRGHGHGFGREHESGRGRDFDPRHSFGPGLGHGFGRGHEHGFGPHHGFGHEHESGFPHRDGFAAGSRRHDHDGHHGRRPGHAGHRAQRIAERAYERGFDAGFGRGRAA
ncbi:hypothetical protein [Microbacterium sp. BLY]|uniref:hypothetical protein n=1 Tax=Microbacterium sp. BLY TaxID=2823280 RepID=UPI001B32A317|nr:hypothetical protein [Microbacterium sp. BLY]MBP3976702.1 hypothetical protein [Microbacterium sp. BLY]